MLKASEATRRPCARIRHGPQRPHPARPLENAEVLDEIEDGFDLDQRTSRNVCEASEFLGTAATHAFGKIQNDAITGTTPLIREVAFGFRKSIDEGTRRYGKPSRMLVCLRSLKIMPKGIHQPGRIITRILQRGAFPRSPSLDTTAASAASGRLYTSIIWSLRVPTLT